jgi:uncharacterized membrane protein
MNIPFYIQTTYLNPLLVSILPVILFQMYRRYVKDITALLGVSVFMFAHPFYRLYPQGGRVATPIIFLALVGLLVTETELGRTRKKILSIMFASGVVVSHYGTSYYSMMALFGALILLQILPTLERLLGTILSRREAFVQDTVQFRSEYSDTPVLSGAFVAFFGTFVIAWYIYTSGGQLFSLPNHFADSVSALYGGDFFSSSTANRVQKSYGYGTTSIRLARYIYIGLIGLMGVGLVAEFYRRLSPSLDTAFPDEYFAISTMFLAFAGSTYVLPVGWGGGRPMMIAFTFVGIFALIGILVPVWVCSTVLSEYWDRQLHLSQGTLRGVAHSVFAIVLATFLILNTGVAAATVIGGSAPMNVPLQPELDERRNPSFVAGAYVETDVQTFAWLQDNRDTEYQMRGDLMANALTDKYRSSIAIAMNKDDPFPYGDVKPRGDIDRIIGNDAPAYTFMLSHNTHLDVYTLNSTYERKPLRPLSDAIDARSRIYSTGHNSIYLGGNGTAMSRQTVETNSSE